MCEWDSFLPGPQPRQRLSGTALRLCLLVLPTLLSFQHPGYAAVSVQSCYVTTIHYIYMLPSNANNMSRCRARQVGFRAYLLQRAMSVIFAVGIYMRQTYIKSLHIAVHTVCSIQPVCVCVDLLVEIADMNLLLHCFSRLLSHPASARFKALSICMKDKFTDRTCLLYCFPVF